MLAFGRTLIYVVEIWDFEIWGPCLKLVFTKFACTVKKVPWKGAGMVRCTGARRHRNCTG